LQASDCIWVPHGPTLPFRLPEYRIPAYGMEAYFGCDQS
jgi:hypothetical protein